jgi:hypothetical protein
MLLAEIHGKVLEGARGHEDYLTSAVFGHLRYVPPRVFWDEFFSHAKTVPVNGSEKSLRQFLRKNGASVSECTSLQIDFWPNHPEWGQPDLVLCFTGSLGRPIVVVFEVKLNSEKSGTEDEDQLVRYLRILDDLPALKLGLPTNPLTALGYLTPRESIREIQSSLASSRTSQADRRRLFRVQWQDLLAAARRTASSADGQSRTILHDVSLFLAQRGLEYFSGFREDPSLPTFSSGEGAFYEEHSFFDGFREDPTLPTFTAHDGAFYEQQTFFDGFREVAGLELGQIERGEWIR